MTSDFFIDIEITKLNNYMMPIFKRSLFVLITLLLLFSCNTREYKNSDKVEQRTIFPQYVITVDATSGKCLAMVSFQVDNHAGFPVVLSQKSMVSCNNQSLLLDKNSEEYCYSLTMESIPEKINFVYINDDGKEFENSFVLNTISFVEQNIIINKTSGGQLAYTSKNPVREDETVTLRWLRGGKIVDELEPEVMSGKRLALNADLLRDLSIGTYTCQMIREKCSSELNAMDRGALFTAIYESNPITITITE